MRGSQTGAGKCPHFFRAAVLAPGGMAIEPNFGNVFGPFWMVAYLMLGPEWKNGLTGLDLCMGWPYFLVRSTWNEIIFQDEEKGIIHFP